MLIVSHSHPCGDAKHVSSLRVSHWRLLVRLVGQRLWRVHGAVIRVVHYALPLPLLHHSAESLSVDPSGYQGRGNGSSSDVRAGSVPRPARLKAPQPEGYMWKPPAGFSLSNLQFVAQTPRYDTVQRFPSSPDTVRKAIMGGEDGKGTMFFQPGMLRKFSIAFW